MTTIDYASLFGNLVSSATIAVSDAVKAAVPLFVIMLAVSLGIRVIKRFART